MKHLPSVFTRALLNGALLFAGGAAFAQTSTGNPPALLPPLASSRPTPFFVASAQTAPPVSRVNVRVELLNLKSLKQQEFFGADEVFVMCMFSAMHPASNSPGAPLVREKNYFDVLWPANLKKGQTYNYLNSGGVVFNGTLPANGSLSGQLRAMEEDVTRKWDISHLARIENILNSVNHDIRLLENGGNGTNRKVTNEEMMRYATKHWNNVSHPNPGPFDDLDDVINTMPLEIPASGAPTEEHEWTAEGDGAIYTLKYRITRIPLSTPAPAPVPAPAPETPAPVPAQPAPVPVTPAPVPSQPAPVPVTPTPVPIPPVIIPPVTPTPVSAFLPLKYFGVRVDRVQPNIAGDKLEVYCTLKNRMARPENINGSMIRVVATDADGVGYDSMGFYRPSGDAELMAGNREVAPQGEIKIRMLIDIAPGTAPLKTLTLWETSSQSQSADISLVQWPGAKAAANLSAFKLTGGPTAFRQCGETLDVRFDGFRKARSGNYEAFFTFKNTSDVLTRDAVLDFNAGSFQVFTLGEDGGKQPYQALARANGETAIPIVMHYAILPSGETRLRYTFSAKDDVPNPITVRFTDRASQTTLEWNVLHPI